MHTTAPTSPSLASSRRPLHHPPRATPSSDPPPRHRPLTLADVRSTAASRGIDLRIREVGPVWEVVLVDAAAGGGDGARLARAAGFTLGPICHIDSLVVDTRRVRGESGARTRPGLSGTGGLAARAVFALASSRGATRAEVLAIDDGDPADAARKVRVYERAAGFKKVADVTGEKVSDFPHLLVWGGRGTRMDADVAAQLARWGVVEEAGDE